MKIVSVAEWSPWSILQYFWPASAIIKLVLNTNIRYFWECQFYTCFTVNVAIREISVSLIDAC